jgi:hypothetical protein
MTRHTVDTIRGSRAEVDTRPEADTKSSQRRQREDVVTQSTKGVIVTKSIKGGLSSQQGHVVTKPTRGRYKVDQRGCRHHVDKKGMLSPSRQEVVTQSTNGVAVTKSPRRGCRHQVDKRLSHSRPKKWGHQVNPRSGDTKSTQEWGHQVNPRSGDTKSTHERGQQVNPRKNGKGHQVNPQKSRRAYQLTD